MAMNARFQRAGPSCSDSRCWGRRTQAWLNGTTTMRSAIAASRRNQACTGKYGQTTVAAAAGSCSSRCATRSSSSHEGLIQLVSATQECAQALHVTAFESGNRVTYRGNCAVFREANRSSEWGPNSRFAHLNTAGCNFHSSEKRHRLWCASAR